MPKTLMFTGLSRIPLATSIAPFSSSSLFNSRNAREIVAITSGLQRGEYSSGSGDAENHSSRNQCSARPSREVAVDQLSILPQKLAVIFPDPC
jgi:hypothetical protein